MKDYEFFKDMTITWPYLPPERIPSNPISLLYPNTRRAASKDGWVFSNPIKLSSFLDGVFSPEIKKTAIKEFQTILPNPVNPSNGISLETSYITATEWGRFDTNPRACSRFEMLRSSQFARVTKDPYNLSRAEWIHLIKQVLQNHIFSSNNLFNIFRTHTVDDLVLQMALMPSVTLAYLRSRLIWMMELLGQDYRWFYFNNKRMGTIKDGNNGSHFNILQQIKILLLGIRDLAIQYSQEILRTSCTTGDRKHHYYRYDYQFIYRDVCVGAIDKKYLSSFFASLIEWTNAIMELTFSEMVEAEMKVSSETIKDSILSKGGSLEKYLTEIEVLSIYATDTYTLFLHDLVETAIYQMEICVNLINGKYDTTQDILDIGKINPETYLPSLGKLITALMTEISSRVSTEDFWKKISGNREREENSFFYHPTMLKMNHIINIYLNAQEFLTSAIRPTCETAEHVNELLMGVLEEDSIESINIQYTYEH